MFSMPAVISIYGILPIALHASGITKRPELLTFGTFFDDMLPYMPLKETTSRSLSRFHNGILLNINPLR